MLQEVSQCYANTRPETGDPERSCTNNDSNSNCYTNTDSNSNLNRSKTFMQMVDNNE